MNDLYDDDILTWSEQQADLLRRRALRRMSETCPVTLDELLTEDR